MKELNKQPAFTFIMHETLPTEWDNFIDEQGGYFVQSSNWASIYEKLGIGKGRYLCIYKEDKLCGQLMIIEGFFGGNLLLDFTPRIIRRIFLSFPLITSYMIRFGPLFKKDELPSAEKRQCLFLLVNYLIDLAKKERKNIGPVDVILFNEKEIAQEFCNQLKKSFPQMKVKMTGTARLDLSQSLEDLKIFLGKKRRNDIKKAESNGVVVKRCSNLRDLGLYFDSLRKEWVKVSVSVPSFSYYKTLFFQPGVSFFMSFHNNKLVAGSGIMKFGQTSLEFSMFVSSYEREKNTRGGDLLKWKLFEFVRDAKAKIFDFNMIDVNESGEKQEKINFFKLKWGGEISYGVELFVLNKYMRTLQKIKYRLIGK